MLFWEIEWNLAKRADNIFNVKLYKSTLFLASIYQQNQYKLNYNVLYKINFSFSSFYCFLYFFLFTCFCFVFIMRAFVSQRLHCGKNSGVSGSKSDDRPQWTQMNEWILHEKYDISTGKQHERFSVQNTNSVIWESGLWSSLRTSCKIVLHTLKIIQHPFQWRDFVEITSF